MVGETPPTLASAIVTDDIRQVLLEGVRDVGVGYLEVLGFLP